MIVPCENEEYLWDITIETLTGASFKIHVLPSEQIMSIKKNIQRVEGIPTSQQHLLFQFKELDNSVTVENSGLYNGATMKLVLSMRGGPISTRRLPVAEEVAWRELQQLMADVDIESAYDTDTDSGWVEGVAGDTAHARRNGMTVLLLRDGDHVSIIRVLVNDDGSYSPLSDSWTGSAFRNLFAETDPLESAQRLKENCITMGKMQELKEKLEKLSLTKQRDKKSDEDDEEEEDYEERHGGRKDSVDVVVDSVISVEGVRISTNTSDDVFGSPTASSSSRASPPLLTTAVVDEPVIDFQAIPHCTASSACASSYNHRAQLVETTTETDTDDDADVTSSALARSPIQRPAAYGSLLSVLGRGADRSSNEPSPCPGSSSATSSFLIHKRHLTTTTAAFPHPSTSSAIGKARKEAENIIRLQSKSLSVFVDHHGFSKRSPLPEIRRTPGRPPASSTCDSPNLPLRTPSPTRIPSSHYAISSTISMPRFVIGDNSMTKKSPATTSRKLAVLSTRRSAAMLDLSQWPLVQMPSSVVDEQKPVGSVVNVDEEVFAKGGGGTTGGGAIKSKKLRCVTCKKRLNITSTYNCRCGGVFCSSHRYPEVHACQFDYKGEGRRLLKAANPLVKASKLPKI